MNVTLYSRQGCHLCEVAAATVRRVIANRRDVALTVVDIDTDPDLVERYTVRVPVVEVDGAEIAEYEVDEATLRAALGPAPTAPAAGSAGSAGPSGSRGPAGPAGSGQPRRRGGRLLRWLGLWLVALLLLVGLTTASVALITPDVLVDACDRPQLVAPAGCPAG